MLEDVLLDLGRFHFEVADWPKLLRQLPDKSVQFTMFSPPYEAQRSYGIEFDKRGEEWVEWIKPVIRECLRVTDGCVAMVCEGYQEDWVYSGSPFLLYADLVREGITTRKPGVFHRNGIPGGAPDFWKNNWEPIFYFTNGGRLPYGDPTAAGHPPKWAPGGAMSYRLSDGTRRNQWGGSASGIRQRRKGEDESVKNEGPRPSHVIAKIGDAKPARAPRGKAGGDIVDGNLYEPPAIAKLGNVFSVNVGGGHMGDSRASENEAPYPESLIIPHVLSLCPPNGIVLDPMCGSGTTLAVALKCGRRAIGGDIRPQMVELSLERCQESSFWFDDPQLCPFARSAETESETSTVIA